MAVFKRGNVWWFTFWWTDRRVQKTTKIRVGPKKNRKAAEEPEAAHRVALAKGEMGISAPKAAPTLKDFAPRFAREISTRCADKPNTVELYAFKMARLLEFEPLASARLDAIDEFLIASYVSCRREKVSPATVNRELATLRRALQLAYEWKLIQRVPRIRLLPGERTREFVLSHTQESNYLAFAPPSRSTMLRF